MRYFEQLKGCNAATFISYITSLEGMNALPFAGKIQFPMDNRLYRIWYLRKLYFHILKNDISKLGFRNAVTTQFPYLFADAEAPPAITVEFTNLCNIKCTYCTSPLKQRSTGWMKEDVFVRMIDDIKQYGIKRVRIVGNGEPTIHPYFGAYLAELKRVTPVVQLTTNGNFINDQIAKDIVNAGINQVNISVDGDNAEAYEKYRINGDFKKLRQNLTDLKHYRDSQKGRLLINVRVMLSPDELHRQDEILSFWEQYADVVSRQYVINVTDVSPTHTFETDAASERYPKCSLPFKMLNIHWNGNVPLCTYSIKQSGISEGYLLGNIKTQNLFELWNSPIIKQYRQAQRKRDLDQMPLCKGCFGT
jgi:MoaA/NifB/PqqE/SkfB family radical SAM enzyme